MKPCPDNGIPIIIGTDKTIVAVGLTNGVIILLRILISVPDKSEIPVRHIETTGLFQEAASLTMLGFVVASACLKEVSKLHARLKSPAHEHFLGVTFCQTERIATQRFY